MTKTNFENICYNNLCECITFHVLVIEGSNGCVVLS